MDNLGNSSQPQPHLDKPTPIEGDSPKPSGPTNGPTGVSRAPLNLGGAAKPPVAAPAPAQAAAPAPAPVPRPVVPAPVARKAPGSPALGERIIGVKTFYAKLHPGAIEFLDDQIMSWLKDNPGISIKHTTVTTGEVQAKKTEPNIIINVWY